MKRHVLLRTSLGLNLLISAALAWALSQRASLAPAVSHDPTSGFQNRALTSVPSMTAAARKTTDVHDWISSLHAAGAPPEVLAQFAIANFAADWEMRRAALRQQWNRGELDDDAWARFNRRHDEEEEHAVRAALGESAFVAWHEVKLLRGLPLERLSLSAGERDALYGLRKELIDRQRDLQDERQAGKLDDAGFTQQQEQAEADYQQKLKAALGDDRYAIVQRPSDSSQGALRHTLKGLQASDAQIAAVLAAETAWQEQRAAADRAAAQQADLSPQAYQAQLRAIDIARDSAIEHALGPDGFDALQKGRDERYQALKRHADLWQLTPDEVDHVYAILRDYRSTVQQYRAETPAPESESAAAQKAVQRYRDNLAQNLKAYLGDTRFVRVSQSVGLELSE
jgi:hypothetical protein